MDVSKFLGRVIGLYLIIVSIAQFANMAQFTSYVNSLISNAPLMFVSGFFTLILGLLMVVGHNIWQWNWRVIITIIGWIALLKGVSIIFYPEFLDHATTLFIQSTYVGYTSAGLDLILGVILCYFAFKRSRKLRK